MVLSHTIKNHVLKVLSPGDVENLGSDLQLVSFELRQTLHESGGPLQYVYFPESVLASVITMMTNGDMVEVGMISVEGVVGVSAFLGKKTAAHHVIAQVQGHAYRMDAGRCKALFDSHPAFRNAALIFVENFLNLASQTSACNRLHSIEQRFARWLLMATDRMHSNDIPMTHEFLSAMLGTRRAGITETAGELQRLGFIRYHHGQLSIINRKGLEEVACECYSTDHMRFKKLEVDEA